MSELEARIIGIIASHTKRLVVNGEPQYVVETGKAAKEVLAAIVEAVEGMPLAECECNSGIVKFIIEKAEEAQKTAVVALLKEAAAKHSGQP